MTNDIYDILKKIGNIVLPALATLVIAFGRIWDLPYCAEIAATISAIAVFLNAILQNESTKYFSSNNQEK